MVTSRWLAVLFGAALFAQGGQRALGSPAKNTGPRFATLEGMDPDAARGKALAWLKAVATMDTAKLAQFEALWKQEERPVVDRLADTFALGSPTAAGLLNQARNPLGPTPAEAPALLRDPTQPEFFRANLALAYARILSNRRVYEEALATLALFEPEQVSDPAGYLFHRAVCEHALLQKQNAVKTLTRLRHQVLDTPERYQQVAALILLDMQAWNEKDLGAVARKMGNIERRLELARGGPQTQKLQKEVIARLDELIKELENKRKFVPGAQAANDGGCPDGGGEKDGQVLVLRQGQLKPATDSGILTDGGTGKVNQRRIRSLAGDWGRLNERERARAEHELEELVSGLSLAHQEAYREYFRRLQEEQGGKGSR